MNTFFKTITTSTLLVLLSACASTDPNAPVDDDYSTSYYWTKHKSTALNLLTSADMHSQYDDVDSKEETSDIRRRNSTAGNLLGNALNLTTFNVGMMFYSIGQNDDDLDPRFNRVSYVSYVPVENDDLSPKEQLVVRESAIASIEKTLHAIGSDKTKFIALPKRNNRVAYESYVNGEACDITKDAYSGTRLMPCHLTISPEIRKVFKTSELPEDIAKDFNSPYVASVLMKITNPLIAVVMAKNINANDFIAFPDADSLRRLQFATTAPVVVQKGVINSFFKPRKKVEPYKNNDISLGLYFKKVKQLYVMPIVVGDISSTITNPKPKS